MRGFIIKDDTHDLCNIHCSILYYFSLEWLNTGSLSDPGGARAASVLQDGRVLVSGGWYGCCALIGKGELYDPLSGTWSVTGNLNNPRYYHTSSLLTDGKVLICGGSYDTGSDSPMDAAELYDPSTNNWTGISNMNHARAYHTAFTLANGKVLVIGGLDDRGYATKKVEVYDPLTKSWTTTLIDDLVYARSRHTSSILISGNVLVTGGQGNDESDSLSSAELFNPSTDSWTVTGSLNNPRYFHTASVLTDGKVLVTGGYDGNNLLTSVELYDPSTGNWTTVNSLNHPRCRHTASVLTDGKILIAGGGNKDGFDVLDSSELYDPATGIWTVANSLNYGRASHTVSILTDGKVLVAGGRYNDGFLKSAEYY